MGTKDPIQGNIELEEDDAPAAVGQIRLNGGVIKGQDSVGVFDMAPAVATMRAGTLAQLNTKVSDATLDDSSSSRPPNGAASGDLAGSYPSPTVAKIRGGLVDAAISPNDGDGLRYNAGTGQWEAQPVGTSSVADIMQFPPATDTSSSATYEALQEFVYGGSDDWGTPDLIQVIAWTEDAGKPQDVRIFDVTNSLVIAELTGITDEVPTIQNLGTISNVPTGAAIWELQTKRPSGPPVTVHVTAMALRSSS